MKTPDAAAAERLVATGPFVFKTTERIRDWQPVPIVGHVQQTTALAAAGTHLPYVVRGPTTGRQTTLKCHIGVSTHGGSHKYLANTEFLVVSTNYTRTYASLLGQINNRNSGFSGVRTCPRLERGTCPRLERGTCPRLERGTCPAVPAKGRQPRQTTAETTGDRSRWSPHDHRQRSFSPLAEQRGRATGPSNGRLTAGPAGLRITRLSTNQSKSLARTAARRPAGLRLHKVACCDHPRASLHDRLLFRSIYFCQNGLRPFWQKLQIRDM